ncbi:hypothetical protein EIP86_008325 [Pleurotus ostreatoroseus]|nr:hypothetical protein EIP86_008325 [Pleurotus ostreatoroseus]
MSRNKRKPSASFYVHSRHTAPSLTVGLSDDGRRVRVRKTNTAKLPLPTIHEADSEAGATSSEFPLDSVPNNDNPSALEGVVHQIEFSDSIPSVRVVAQPKAKRYENSDAPLTTFLKYRQAFLDEDLRTEGRGDFSELKVCLECGTPNPCIRCKDCFGGELFCEGCTIKHHERLPLHLIERFNNGQFEDITLADLGLKVALGHAYGGGCALGQAREIVVLHTNGIHRVNVAFCQCDSSLTAWQQLMRVRWWPATVLNPSTAATFAVMRQFHYQNLHGNITAYDFYRSLEYLTDGRLLAKIPDREYQFGIMVREWRNIKMLKRFGRGHESAGVESTQPGQLVVPCRACPHPGKNLPKGWENVGSLLAFLYYMCQAQDANFRLKARFRATNVQDVCLSPGWGCFVEHKEYLAHVKKFANQEEISTCAGFQAVYLANLKKMRGLSATGVAGNACSRHEMWRTLGDLQKGERYCNMDYILATSLISIVVLSILITYDIACQFFANFWARIDDLPPRLRPSVEKFKDHITAKVPKGHIVGHIKDCQGVYSLNYTRGAGRLDGEGIERCWSWLNKAAASTKEMGSSARRETIDDFCNFANYRKMLGLGDSLLRRMLEALKEAANHKTEFKAFDKAVRKEHSALVARWQKEVDDFAQDCRKPCPYIVNSSTMTLQDAKLKLMAEEEQQLRQGQAAYSTQEGGPTAFILLGVEIEESQAALKRDIQQQEAVNTLRQTTRMERRIALWKKIQQFRKAQTVYMPGLSGAIENAEERTRQSSWQEAENVPLYMPSSQDPLIRPRVCDAKIAAIEETIREAQAYESLDELRNSLRARVFANKFKIKNVTGQRANTKARDWQKTIDHKAIVAKHAYRRARAALLALRGPGEWSNKVLCQLNDADVRAFNERAMTEEEMREREEARRAAGLVEEEVLALPVDDGASLGEGRRSISWIWYSTGTIGLRQSDEDLDEALKVEWARSQSRSERWCEEVALLWEEMRRATNYSRWLASWWEARCEIREDTSPQLREGLAAYAKKQATSERTLAQRWDAKFAPVRARAEEFLKTTHLASVLSLKNLEYTDTDDTRPANRSLEDEEVCPLPQDMLELRLEDPAEAIDADDYE